MTFSAAEQRNDFWSTEFSTVFPPFNHSLSKHILLPACLCKWFGQNKPRVFLLHFGQNKTQSIFSTF